MFDDSVKILTNVRHVLGLKRNMISIGMLDESSISWKTEKGFIYICKGSVAIIKGVKKNSLYVSLSKTMLAQVMLL